MHTFSINNQQQPFINYNNKQSCPATLHNSTEASFEQQCKKFSTAELSTMNSNKINIDQVMLDIKLTPLKSCEFSEKIKTIYACLNYIKNFSPSLLEQVRTAQLVIENIESKFAKQLIQTTRNNNLNGENVSYQRKSSLSLQSKIQSRVEQHSSSKATNKKQDSQGQTNKKSNLMNTIHSDVSPIKQLDQPTSRIVYANFSIKEIQNSCKKQLTNQKSVSVQKASIDRRNFENQYSNKKTTLNQSQSSKVIKMLSGSKTKIIHKRQNSNFTVSNFDADDEEMEKLTKNIKALDHILEQKGLGFGAQLSRGKGNKMTGLKQVNLNSYKQSLLKSERKPLVFQSRQKMNTNKENY